MGIDEALTSPAFFVDGDPHPIWRQLRHDDPVHWTSGILSKGFWSVTRHEDVVAVFSDAAIFSSTRGIALPSSPEMEGLSSEEAGSGKMMIMTDPPLHGAMRRGFNRLFLPRPVGKYESAGDELVHEILDRVLERGECDFVLDVAARLPMAFICEIMGMPREDWPMVFKWANMSIGFEDPEYQVESGSPLETRQQGFIGLGNYCAQLALERRGSNGEDLLSVLGNTEINGRKLDEDGLMLNGWLYVLGGMETTRNAISGGLLALIQFPDQRERLIANPALMPSAIEEILRWTSPITHITRAALRETSIGGRTIRAGDKVALWLPSANRDQEVFKDPFEFDLARTPNEHVAFGKGEHFCAGAHLARLELRLMLRALLAEIDEVELAGPVERLQSNLVAGVKHMPVRFRQTSAAA